MATKEQLIEKYKEVRNKSVELINPLSSEEWRIQSMRDVSPPWWNFGHTSWFFARNILNQFGEYNVSDGKLDYLLNSYYESLGPRLPRDKRGIITNPTNEDILVYRSLVDQRMIKLIESSENKNLEKITKLTEIGIQHEQQHQELMLTEIKHIRFQNPQHLRRQYTFGVDNEYKMNDQSKILQNNEWITFKEGLYRFGNIEGGWCWDNELPVHKAYLHSFLLQKHLVTNAEFLEFIKDNGYGNPLLWLSNGWDARSQKEWNSPLYWERDGDSFIQWTLQGMKEINSNEPVSHVSFYEAYAFAEWKSQNFSEYEGIRLPTEYEWEHATRTLDVKINKGNFMESKQFHPFSAYQGDSQMMGNLWEWTSSHYEPYPGYKSFEGALSEYNKKFMDNQRVLRGGSCATPRNHVRISYRNFWPADTRFQFTGVRLARDM